MQSFNQKCTGIFYGQNFNQQMRRMSAIVQITLTAYLKNVPFYELTSSRKKYVKTKPNICK